MGEQCIAELLDCFPVLKVEPNQAGVVLAYRPRDGVGVRGHAAEHVPARGM